MGSRRGAPTDVYPCKPGGANDYLFIMAVTTRQWDTLCAVIGQPELVSDPRFETGPARQENGDALYEEIARWTRERTKYDAMRELAGAGVPCSAVLETQELFTDPHLVERGLIQTVEHPTAGPVKLMRQPVRMSGSEVPLVAAPLLGQHTDAVLQADLCLGADEIAALRENGVVG
jgi:formyl-CoA transferase